MTTTQRIPFVKLALAIALALSAAFALPAAAQVYKWTDDKGKVHYSNQKPPQTETKDVATVKLDPGPTATTAPANGATPPAGAAAPAAAGDAKPNDEVATQLAALDQQRCNAAKAVAARYETAPYLQAAGPDGQMRKLSIEEEATERLKVKSDVEKLCKGR